MLLTDELTPRSSKWNIPNLITAFRILLAPVLVWCLLLDNGADSGLRWAAAALFMFAIATDGIDGAIARATGKVTNLGKLLDPIADKVLTGGAFVTLTILGELPTWITVIVLVREIGITFHRMIVASDHVVAAAWMGKFKTLAQAVAISLALLPLVTFWGVWPNIVTMMIAVFLTIASGIDYVITVIRGQYK